MEREFRSSRKLFKTPSLDESSSHEFDLFYDLEENFEEEVADTMAETMEEYMCKTRSDYGLGVTRPKIDDKEVDINKKTENQAKMTKLSMEWKRLCKIKAKVQKCQSQSQYRRISSQTGAGTEEYYWMQS
ncbi:hypothetical protein Tco_1240468 [Tanacetum coccineum]